VSLKRSAIIGYSVGHIPNDMTASIWFTYLMILLGKVFNLPNGSCGLVMLVGQIADAIATPAAGLISDASHGCALLRLGRRKWIYLLGATIVATSMFFMFGYCVPYILLTNPSQMIVTVYACVCAVVLNIGWAMANVCPHLHDFITSITQRGPCVLIKCLI
jgi:Na+/melibiose symporter-like transporter